MDHWALSAKNLIGGLILYVMHKAPSEGTLNDVRHLLTLPYQTDEEGEESLSQHFEAMLGDKDAYDGVLAGVGGSMLGKPDNERGSIISTAMEQTSFLDSKRLRTHLAKSGLPSMRILKERPATIYLVLPASRMGTHFRWLPALNMVFDHHLLAKVHYEMLTAQ